MRKTLLILIMIWSSQAWSSDLSAAALQGDWVIVAMGGMADDEGDMWQFEGNLFYQNLGGMRISPDKFSIKGNVIDLDGYEIKVMEFNKTMMKADMAGFKYHLKKK